MKKYITIVFICFSLSIAPTFAETLQVFEYKTVSAKMGGFTKAKKFQGEYSDLLNMHSRDGWRFKETVIWNGNIHFILERKVLKQDL